MGVISPFLTLSFINSCRPATCNDKIAQELAQEIKAFINGVDPIHGNKLTVKDHARCAILLLRNLPPARNAVLEHLCNVFDEYVSNYILELENESSSGSLGPNLDDIIQEIENVLSEFVRINPKAWAPLVSAWSIDLMGQLSSKYAGRHGVPHASSLNELLQLWMSCKATRTLMEIYTQCLSSLINSCPDACVDALLDTSVQHSPHFDWVVAHIGSSFPNTIISRVLSCGLKDFCVHGAASADVLFPSAADKRIPKIASVVGILGHLAPRHSESIKQELLKMFHESLGPLRDQQQKVTVPFLLQLAVMSPMLLSTISSELVDSLKPSVLNQLHQHFATLPREDLENMVSLIVHLICQTAYGAYRILQFLVNTAMPASVITTPGLAVQDSVREACDRIIQLLLLNLQKLVYNRTSTNVIDSGSRVVPFLDELKNHVRDLCIETLRLERKRYLWQHQLLGLLSIYCSSCATDALCFMLTLAKNPEELSLGAQLYAVLSSSVKGLLPTTVKKCVSQIHSGSVSEQHMTQLFSNLALIIQWDKEDIGPASMSSQVAQIVSLHLYDFGQLLLHRNPNVCEAAALLLSVSPMPKALKPADLMTIVRAAVHHFFSALHRKNGSGIGHISKLLFRLSSICSATMKTILQHLVEGAMHRGNLGLFGGKSEQIESNDLFLKDSKTSLLDVNYKFGTAVNFSGSIWSVFHAGVIGQGLKPFIAPVNQDKEAVLYNIHHYMNLIIRCCSGGKYHTELNEIQPPIVVINPEAAKTVAVVLVENICPDVSNSELAWPPEEYTKNTVERDIQIRKCFEENPLLFELLRFVSIGRPALCYCSVVLRGLLATLMAHWEAKRDNVTTTSPWYLQASCNLIACMGEGHLLPPVLSNMHEIFDKLTPFEVHLLLLSVWDYMRDNSPLPQKFTFNADKGLFYRDFSRDGDINKYLSVVQSVVHKNIENLGLFGGRFQV
ncbi:integrator complex subunit 5 isoform X2 [Protopterus annectens]|uniref:integrator complex subunit 5 isoform X2 n=1 Tax=Protopterus annectens TaxID=7888 RepID=UPI001CFA535F|nr:integrator complex subunit 5 isoform X2 [Protopterus annectens]